MVQSHKNLHKFYISNRDESQHYILNNHIPFYAEIENITLSKESIFHQLKEFKPNMYYQKLWLEVCERMGWNGFAQPIAPVVGIDEEIIHPQQPGVSLQQPEQQLRQVAQ